MSYWISLGLAIAVKTIGMLSMKWASIGRGNSGSILMLVMIALSHIFSSLIVKEIALGMAYTLWEDTGILFITLFSVLLFDETLSMTKVAGLVSLALGIVLIKSGTRRPAETSKEVAYAAV